MKKLLPYLIQFYLTILIPLAFFLTLGVIAYTPTSFPSFLLPVAILLSHNLTRIINLIIAFSGIILWISSYWHLRHHFGVLPNNSETIQKTTSGPYRYLKHPMYLAIFLTFTGLALANLSFPGFLINLLMLTPINCIRAKFE